MPLYYQDSQIYTHPVINHMMRYTNRAAVYNLPGFQETRYVTKKKPDKFPVFNYHPALHKARIVNRNRCPPTIITTCGDVL